MNNNQPDERIIKFIGKHHVLTLATAANNIPWCAQCFYAFMEDENAFVFSTDITTQHGKEAIDNPTVAASILLETQTIGKIQGLQIAGIMQIPEGDLKLRAEKRYLKRFPYARLMDTNIWVLMPKQIKMTHNQLGFGKKLIWVAE